MSTATGSGQACFNGAAFSRTRKHGNSWAIQSRKPSCFNGAAFSRTRKLSARGAQVLGDRASMGPRSHERGKFCRTCGHSTRTHASMGPRSHERGKVNPLKWAFPASRLQWGRVLTNAERSIRSSGPSLRHGFNGAAFSRTRKVFEAVVPMQRRLKLQWGRVLTNAERIAAGLRNMAQTYCFNGAAFSRTRKVSKSAFWDIPVPASMGPRSHERGKRTRRRLTSRWAAGFNGAAFSRTRKGHVRPKLLQPSSVASMGPRSHERGKTETAILLVA